MASSTRNTILVVVFATFLSLSPLHAVRAEAPGPAPAGPAGGPASAPASAAPAGADNPIPDNKDQIGSWFDANVGPLSSRKASLDPALVTAEETPKTIKVSASGGEFKTIMDAVNSVPAQNTQRVIISIASGTYEEKVKIPLDKPFITLLGDASSNPVIVSAATASKVGTVDSATMIVLSDYFMGVNLDIKNSSPMPTGKEGEQAVALRITGDKAAMYNCKVYGYQDTVCDDKGKHFYKDCHIEGTVDFIFGNGKTIFLNADLNVINSGGFTMITAHARSGPSEDTGFSIVHSKISGNATNAMLGRAWMPAPKVIYSFTEMSGVVSPEGWSDNFHPDRDKTVFYGEYKNTGPGADRAKRASFSKELSPDEVKPFLSLAFIEGSKWLLPPPKA